MLLAYTIRNNDVFAFLYPEDIEQLPQEVNGFYRNGSGLFIPAYLRVSQEREEKTWTDCRKNDDGVYYGVYGILCSPSTSERLKLERQIGDHQGYRHINLIDTSSEIEFTLLMNLEILRTEIEEFSNSRND